MLPKLCLRCNKWFSCKSSLNRHTKKLHRTHVQPPVDDDSRQSGGLCGDDDVQSTSQTTFKNADNEVDVASQKDFDNTKISEKTDKIFSPRRKKNVEIF